MPRRILGPGDASPWGADALTVSPYLGDDSLTPFVDVAQRAARAFSCWSKRAIQGASGFRTSWPMAGRSIGTWRSTSSRWRQRRPGRARLRRARNATEGIHGTAWSARLSARPIPQQLAELRQAMPHTWLLIPGFGAQGGTAKDCAAAFDEHGLGAIVNNSRGIIFAHSRKDWPADSARPWQEAVEAATREMIDQLRAETPPSRL